jgi:hypothetical protein
MATAKPLTLDQVVGRYKHMADQAFLDRCLKQVQSYAIPVAAGPLQDLTLQEYMSVGKLLLKALTKENTGHERSSLPCLAELLMRPHGAKVVNGLMKLCTERRKVNLVCCSLLQRSIPELGNENRLAALKAWQEQLRLSMKDFNKQRSVTGYGGNLQQENIPAYSLIESGIQKLQPGDPDRLLLRIFCEAPFKGAFQYSAPYLNLGACRVFLPSEANQVPTAEHVFKMALSEAEPKAWWVMDRDPHKDRLIMVLGPQGSRENIGIDQHAKVPLTLAQELRANLQKRPVNTHKWLFTDQRHSVNIAEGQPYTGPSGRSSFLARTNRLLWKIYGCRLRAFRVAIAQERQHRVQEELGEPPQPQ